jgi:hypothetical protein
MSAIHFRASVAAVAISCLAVSLVHAQTPAKPAAKPAVRAPAAAGPWAKVPPPSTLCYQYTATNVEDPYYAKHEAAKTAIAADRDAQLAINAKIKEEFDNIDPMEQAQRMQQWMMDNPQEAMAHMQAAQNAGLHAPTNLQTAVAEQEAKKAEWNALKKSYDDARAKAYAPLQARRKAFAPDTTAAAYLVVPIFLPESDAGAVEGETITGQYDRAYKALCPQWWGANGKFQAYLKKEKDRFATERTAELANADATKLQQYAMFSTPAATYRSIAAHEAALEYLDLAYKVYGEREIVTGCETPRSCDGAYP